MTNLPPPVADASALPLSGIKVVDFTQVMLGPVCTQVLGDYGADVIKIERQGSGDLSRTTFGPVAGNDNPVFCSLNRNKRSVAVDLKNPQHMERVRALIAGCDVVVNNFRAGVMDRMGLGYEACRAMNPGIIYAFGTGFGETGPYAHKGGQDVLAQAMSGAMERRADKDLPLSVYPTTFADYSAGMHLVQGILLALLQRQRTGQGQKVSVALFNSMLAAQMQEAAMLMMADSEINWAAMPLTGVFHTLDGAIVVVGAFKANPMRDICHALEIDDLSLDPRFADLPAQIAHKAQIKAIFRERYLTRESAHWLARLEAVDILCAPVKSLREALADEQTAVNRLILHAQHRGQGLRVVGSPISMSGAQVGIRRPPPRLGEHSDEVFASAWGAA
jgi:formyl-CoA transferase